MSVDCFRCGLHGMACLDSNQCPNLKSLTEVKVLKLDQKAFEDAFPEITSNATASPPSDVATGYDTLFGKL